MIVMKRAGFTLIELLVVIGILCVLMALTSTVSHSVREQARATKCQKNIKDQCLGLFAYSIENGCFPRGMVLSFNTISDVAFDPPAKWWFESIGQEYDIVHKLVQCPAKQLDSSRQKHNVLWGNYGANWSIFSSSDLLMPNNVHDFARTSLAYGRVRNPGQVLLIMDSGHSLLGRQHAANPVKDFSVFQGALATSYIPGLSTNKDRELHIFQRADADEGRHPDHSVNVGFADGHVDKKKADDLSVGQTAEGHYTNRTPLWKPR